jgi:hypothetical protein
MISGGMRSVLMPYGNRWRVGDEGQHLNWRTEVVKRVRCIFSNVFIAKKCDSYSTIQENEAFATLHSIRDQPSAFSEEIHRYSLSAARCITFGKHVQTHSEPFAVQVQKLMEQFTDAIVANMPRFGYDTHSRRSRDVCETVCETQGKVVCIISMRLALWFPK